MDVKKTLVALGISAALAAGMPTAAIAKKADEDDSVYRWGRWAVLAPAAGVEETLSLPASAANEIGRCEAGANCPEPQSIIEPPPPPEPPKPPEPPQPEVKSPCEPGMPCGFARVDRDDNESETENDYVASFRLEMNRDKGEAPDTVAFGVGAGTLLDPNTTAPITSDTEAASYTPGGVRTTDFFSDTILRGRIEQGEGADGIVVQGPWQQGVDTGEYAWGIAATALQLSDLADVLGEVQMGDRVAYYSGTLADSGSMALQVDLVAATWSGQFNGDVEFSVDNGKLVGPGLVTDNTADFSDNIARGKVSGALVNGGHTAIGGYEVETTNGLKDADIFKAGLEPRYQQEY